MQVLEWRGWGARIGLVLSALLVLAACGREAGEDDPIPVGALLPLTGAGGEFAPRMQQAIDLAVEEVNRVGGPMGRPLEIITEDGQTDPDAAVRGAQKLIDVDQAVAIIGTWDSGSTLAVAPLAIDAGVILMNTSGSPDISDLEDDDLVWRFEAPGPLFGEAMARAALQLDWSPVSTMAMNDPSALGDIEGFADYFTANGGEILEEVVFNPAQPSYRSDIGSAADVDPDAIVITGYTPEFIVIFREAREAGVEMPWLGQAFAITEDLAGEIGSEAVANALVINTIPDLDSPTYEDVADRFLEATGTPLVNDVYSAQAYDMVVTLALAMESCQCEDGPGIAEHIRGIANPPGQQVFSYEEAVGRLRDGEEINYEGISSALDFDERGDPRPDFGLFGFDEGTLEFREQVPMGG